MSARISVEEFQRLSLSADAPRARRHKYNARYAWRCSACNLKLPKKPERGEVCLSCGSAGYIRFDSQAEARHWDSLCQQQRLGRVSHLKRQVVMPITINGKIVGTYLADFTYIDSEGIERIDDVKGKDTDLSKLKRRCVEAAKGVKVNLIKIS